MQLERIYLPALLSLGSVLLALPACADIIDVGLTSPLSGSPADTLTFEGTLANDSGGDLWINEVGLNLAGFDPSDLDPTDFILNATGLLANGTSLGPVDFFAVTIPDPFVAGPYEGVITVQGGATADDDAVLGTANFEVDVNSAAATVPEPNAVPIILIVALGAALKFRLRRAAESTGRRESPAI
jgi:hypothetical protein